jgi:hypothetical protein
MGVLPGSAVVAAARCARARAGVGGRYAPATVAGTVVSLGRGVARGEEGEEGEEAGTGDEDAAEAAAAGEAGTLAAASPWPPSTTVSATATPATARTPPATATPDRKLTSSIRAYIALFSRPKPTHFLSRTTQHDTWVSTG